MGNDRTKICRVCGWYPEKYQINYTIYEPGDYCDCCMSEFCVTDVSLGQVRSVRKQWIENGAKWDEPSEMPDDWDLKEQLSNIPEEWR